MRKLLKQILSSELFGGSEGGGEAEHDYQLATAVLLVEMARADNDVTQDELQTILASISQRFDLNSEESSALLEVAQSEADRAVSLYDYTSELNRLLDRPQKRHIVELLWEVAFADGRVDRYEDHFVRKVADLLYLKHSEFMQAKHKMKKRREAPPQRTRSK